MGWHTLSPLGWNHAGGDGQTSTHYPRLPAAQQPSRHEQIPAGDFEDQTVGAGQIGRRYFADGDFADDKPDSMNYLGAFLDGNILVQRLSSPNIPLFAER